MKFIFCFLFSSFALAFQIMAAVSKAAIEDGMSFHFQVWETNGPFSRQPSEKLIISGGIREKMNPETVWLKTSIVNFKPNSEVFYWILNNSYIDTVEFWKQGKYYPEFLGKTGLAFPFSSRPIETEPFVLPIKINPNETTIIYTKLGIRAGSLTSAFYVLNEEGFKQWEKERNRFNFIFLILLANILLVSIVVALVSRKALMAFYALYLFGFMLFQFQTMGYAYHYFWPNSPLVALLAKGFIQLFAIFFFWLFCGQFVKTSHLRGFLSPKLKRILGYLFPFVIFVILGVNYFFGNKVAGGVLMVILYGYLLTGISEVVYCVVNKFRPAYGVALAISFPILASLYIFFVNFGLLPYSKQINYAFPVAYTLETSLLLCFTIYFLRRQSRIQEIQNLRFVHHRMILAQVLPELKNLNTRAEVQEALRTEMVARNTFPPEMLQADFELMEKALILQKLYTNPEITLQALAKELGLNFGRASRAINTIAKKNFSEWINDFRTTEALKLLESDLSEKYTLEAVAQMAGFGSRTNFHTVFKKNTGISPSEFRNRRLKGEQQ